jgi:hypothetical protein
MEIKKLMESNQEIENDAEVEIPGAAKPSQPIEDVRMHIDSKPVS